MYFFLVGLGGQWAGGWRNEMTLWTLYSLLPVSYNVSFSCLSLITACVGVWAPLTCVVVTTHATL